MKVVNKKQQQLIRVVLLSAVVLVLKTAYIRVSIFEGFYDTHRTECIVWRLMEFSDYFLKPVWVERLFLLTFRVSLVVEVVKLISPHKGLEHWIEETSVPQIDES